MPMLPNLQSSLYCHRKGNPMNYEQEFELLATLYPISAEEHVIAALAILDARRDRVSADEARISAMDKEDIAPRLRELMTKGVEHELAAIEDLRAVIMAKRAAMIEETEARSRKRGPGRPKGSRTKRPAAAATEVVANDPLGAPEEPQVEDETDWYQENEAERRHQESAAEWRGE